MTSNKQCRLKNRKKGEMELIGWIAIGLIIFILVKGLGA